MKTLEIGSVAVADITIPPRLRDVDANYVSVIAETIRAKGQLQDIILRRDAEKLILVAGGHRLAAMRKLEWGYIQARIVELDDADEAAELEAIENLARNELSVVDKAVHLAVLRDIHKRRNPAARRGGDRKVQKLHLAEQGEQQLLHFDAEVAKTLKLSRRSVYNYLAIADGLDPAALQRVKGSILADNFVELQALSREDKKAQGALLDLILAPEPKAKTVSAAASLHFNRIDTATPDERHFAAFMKLWSKASKKVRKQIATQAQRLLTQQEKA